MKKTLLICGAIGLVSLLFAGYGLVNARINNPPPATAETDPIWTAASTTYLTTSSAASTYLTTSSAASTYLTNSSATATYFPLSASTSLSWYLTTTTAADTYLTTSTASSTYLTNASATATYLTLIDATATYMPYSVSSTFLTTTTAASTYAALAGTNSFSGVNTFGNTIVMGSSTQYSPSLAIDGDYNGFVITGTADAALSFGNIVYLQTSSTWTNADADASTTAGDVLLGVCVQAAGGAGSSTIILLQGFVRADAVFPTFTTGSPIYVSTDAGGATTTLPSGTDDVIRRAGWSYTADEIYFNPSNDYLTHT